MKRVLVFLPTLILALSLALGGCSGADKEAYQRGYESGYAVGREKGRQEGTTEGYQRGFAEGRQQGLAEGTKAGEVAGRDAGYKMGYVNGYKDGHVVGSKDGYEKGFAESTRLFGPKEELVKILSYKLVRGNINWVEVVGELQNLSNRRLGVTVTGVVLDSKGEILKTGFPWQQDVAPQEKAFFSLLGFHEQPKAVDARLTVKWEQR